jgi:glycopeptide antibiotics resistance protein
MNTVSKTILKIGGILVVFLPYKFILMAGRQTTFIQDLIAATTGYALAYGIIYLIERRNNPD